MGGNDQNRAKKQNVVLTSFRPVTWSSGHLGRLWFSCIARYRAIIRQGPPKLAYRNYVRSMLLVSQLKLPSRSYRAIGGIAAILSQIAV